MKKCQGCLCEDCKNNIDKDYCDLDREITCKNCETTKSYCPCYKIVKMTDKSRIEKGLYWDEAWSLVSGCTPVSEGCQNCWSSRETHMRAENPNEKVKARNEGLTADSGQFNGRIRLNHEFLDKPLRKKKPTTYAIWNDLFHEDVQFEFIHKAWDIMKACPQHTFLILTKRPLKMAEAINRIYNLERFGWAKGYWNHVWLGVTAENQARADERIPILLHIPAAVRFVSVEPMIGPVDLSKWVWKPVPWAEAGGPNECKHGYAKGIHCPNCMPPLDWVICGGETGPGARPMHSEWIRSLRDQCQAAGVPFFFKSWGEWAEHTERYGGGLFIRPDGSKGCQGEYWAGKAAAVRKVGKKHAGRLLDGRTWDEMPEL